MQIIKVQMEEINYLNDFISTLEMESVKNILTRQTSGPDVFNAES